jgi:hypothetical protein
VRIAILVVVAAAVAVAGLAACAGDESEPPRVLVDERDGVLHGVRFGEPLEVVRRIRGEPTDDADGFFPEGADFTGPPSIPNPPSDQGVRPTPLHYDDTAYLVLPSVGVYAMATLEGGARTRAGVGVGDDLELVRDRYERVACGEAIGGEAIVGETPKYPWCQAIIGDIGVFFGEDPIESITLLSRRPRARR